MVPAAAPMRPTRNQSRTSAFVNHEAAIQINSRRQPAARYHFTDQTAAARPSSASLLQLAKTSTPIIAAK